MSAGAVRGGAVSSGPSAVYSVGSVGRGRWAWIVWRDPEHARARILATDDAPIAHGYAGSRAEGTERALAVAPDATRLRALHASAWASLIRTRERQREQAIYIAARIERVRGLVQFLARGLAVADFLMLYNTFHPLAALGPSDVGALSYAMALVRGAADVPAHVLERWACVDQLLPGASEDAARARTPLP